MNNWMCSFHHPGFELVAWRKYGRYRFLVAVVAFGAGHAQFALEAVAVVALVLLGEHVGVVHVRAARAGVTRAETQIGACGLAEVYDRGLVAGVAFRAGHEGLSW